MHFQDYSAEPSLHAGFLYMKDVVKLMELNLPRQNEVKPGALHEAIINNSDEDRMKW